MNASAFPESPLPELPYRGIKAFRFVDHPIFSARRWETEKLLRWVTVYRGVLLYGAPGVGKSSLINAGLAPGAIAEGFSPVRIRVQPRPGNEIIVERIPLTDDGQPPFLTSFLTPSPSGEPRIVLSAANLVERLRERRDGLPPLLVFDQFEEFVTLFEEAPQADRQEAAAAQAAVLAAITELLRDHSFSVKLLFAFREDYFGKLNRLFAKYPALLDHGLRLLPPEIGALPAIVGGPFRDERLRAHFGRELPAALIDDIVREVESHVEGSAINLTEVEIACLRLWNDPSPAALLKRRGIQGLMEDYLAESVQQLGNLRDPAIALLAQMVTALGTRNVISEENLLQLVCREEGLPEPTLRDALRALEERTGLVRRERRNDVAVYEIVSEFLVPWIRRQRQERQQRRKEQRFQKRTTAVAAAVLLVLGGGLIGKILWVGKDRAVEDARRRLSDRDTELKAVRSDLRQAQGSAAAAQERLQASEARHRADFERNEATWKGMVAEREQALDKLRAALEANGQQRRALEKHVEELTAADQKTRMLLATCDAIVEGTKGTTQQLREQVATSLAKINSCEEALKIQGGQLANCQSPTVQFYSNFSWELNGVQSNLNLLTSSLGRIDSSSLPQNVAQALAEVRMYRDKVAKSTDTLIRMASKGPPKENKH